jgi:hypothetical protein
MIKALPIFLLLSAAATAFGPPLAIGPPTTIGPGQPTVILVGKLSCAARMYTPTQLQVWCFKDLTFTTLAINILTDVSDCGFNLFIADDNNFDTNTTLNWTFFSASPPPAPPPGTPPAPPSAVTWQAQIVRAGISDPMINGILN